MSLHTGLGVALPREPNIKMGRGPGPGIEAARCSVPKTFARRSDTVAFEKTPKPADACSRAFARGNREYLHIIEVLNRGRSGSKMKYNESLFVAAPMNIRGAPAA